MFHLLIAFLVACSTALAAESQYADYRLGMLNPDLIYFNEGGQRYPLNVLPVATRRQQEVSDLKNENNVPGANKLPLPVNMIPDGPVGPPPVANVNPLQRPSAELTPPDYKPIPTNNDLQKQTELVNRFAEDSDTKAPNVQQNSSTPVDNVSIGVSQFGINIIKVIKNKLCLNRHHLCLGIMDIIYFQNTVKDKDCLIFKVWK